MVLLLESIFQCLEAILHQIVLTLFLQSLYDLFRHHLSKVYSLRARFLSRMSFLFQTLMLIYHIDQIFNLVRIQILLPPEILVLGLLLF